MAFDTFLKFEGLDGESTRSGFEKWIEIYSFSWGASNPVTIGAGTTGAAAGKVSISSFNIMKKSDSASPTLFQYCCVGKHFPTATVKMNKASGDATALVFLEYDFTEVYVESVQWSGSTGGDDTPTESVSLAFGSVKISYTPQTTSGAPGTPVRGSWDLTKVKA
jgi:type VI secretion system secreted protein Hcp